MQRILSKRKRKPWRKRRGFTPKAAHDATFLAQVRRSSDLYTRPLQPHERVRCADEHTRTGQVWGEVAPRKRQAEFLALLEQVDAALFDRDGLRQLNDWKFTGREQCGKEYKGIFVRN